MRFLVLTALAFSACGSSAVSLSVNTDRNMAQANGSEAITITATVMNGTVAVQGATVTFSVPEPGVLSETSVVTDAQGQAVTKLTSTSAGALVVTVATADAPNDVKPSFTFTQGSTGAATRLVFSTSPSTTPLGNLLRPIPTVVLVGSNGMTVTTATNQVTLRLTPGSCAATFDATSLFTVSARMGEASFGGLKPASAGTGCTLTAESTGFAPVVSTAFDIQ